MAAQIDENLLHLPTVDLNQSDGRIHVCGENEVFANGPGN